MLKTIALFGGTFDPIHQGHVQSAMELKQRLHLDELRLLPCHKPPHRQAPGASSEQRLAMVTLALEGSDLLVDDRELKRESLSYSVETLEQCRRELGDQVSLSWVMGTDAFAQFDHWHRWQDFLSLAHIIVMARPGESLPQGGPVVELMAAHHSSDHNALRNDSAGKIFTLNLQPYPISASELRLALAAHCPVDQNTGRPGDQQLERYLSTAVLNYIHERRIYHDADDLQQRKTPT